MLSKHTVECIKVFLWNRISELFSSSVCPWAFFCWGSYCKGNKRDHGRLR